MLKRNVELAPVEPSATHSHLVSEKALALRLNLSNTKAFTVLESALALRRPLGLASPSTPPSVAQGWPEVAKGTIEDEAIEAMAQR